MYFNPKSNLTGEQLVGVGGHELSDIFDQRPQGRPSVRPAFVLSLSDIPRRRSNAGCGQSDGRDLSALLPSLPFVIKAFKLAAETGRWRRLSRRQVTSQTACRLFASFFCKKKLGPLQLKNAKTSTLGIVHMGNSNNSFSTHADRKFGTLGCSRIFMSSFRACPISTKLSVH